MSKYRKYLAIMMIMICLLPGCGNEKTVDDNKGDSSSSLTQKIDEQDQNVQKHLLEAKDMESIELTGQEILDGKEVNMSVKISDNINMDFHISRDNPNGTKLYAIYNSQAYNLAVNYISPDVFEDDEAIPSYNYQICCYDFNNDGIKEVAIACGNKNNELSIFVFDVSADSQDIFYPANYILGYKDAYVNESNEICVPSKNEVKTYKYNITSEDAEYSKISGPIKISVDYATKEQLEKYKSASKFIIDEDGPSFLILPKETLANVTVCSIEYDADTDMHVTVNDLFNIPMITPDKPLILQYFMGDLPTLGVSYTDESGIEQFCGIAESLEDGSIYLFEMGIAKG